MTVPWPCRQLCIILILSSIVCLLLLYQTSFPRRPLEIPALGETPIIFVLTPTYSRPTQLADMTRLCNTLMHIRSIFWIVIEDADHTSKHIEELLEFCKVPGVYLAKRTPKHLTKAGYGRGVANRNEGLRWLRNNVQHFVSNRSSGVLYFADDDNAYDIRLFEEIRKTDPDKVSMFPVGTIAVTGISTPIIHSNGSFLGYFDPYHARRRYMVDMAGFAVGINRFIRSNATFMYRTGELEDDFLRKLAINEGDIQFLAEGCTRLLVWHVKTIGGPYITTRKLEPRLRSIMDATNLRELIKSYSVVSH